MTGYTWEKLSPYYSMAYADQVANLPSGFVPATLAQIADLELHAPVVAASDFQTVESIMGVPDPTPEGRSLIWGNSAGGSPNFWVYAYNDANGWQGYDPADSSAFLDLGIFAVINTAPPLPEPATLVLFGIGLAGMRLGSRVGRATVLSLPDISA